MLTEELVLGLDFQEGETPQVPGLLEQDVSAPDIIQKFCLVSDGIPSSCLMCHGCKFKGSDKDRVWEHSPAALLCSPPASKQPLPTSHHPDSVVM